MENILAVMVIFMLAICLLLYYAVVRNEKDKEEFEHYMNDHAEKRIRHGHGI